MWLWGGHLNWIIILFQLKLRIDFGVWCLYCDLSANSHLTYTVFHISSCIYRVIMCSHVVIVSVFSTTLESIEIFLGKDKIMKSLHYIDIGNLFYTIDVNYELCTRTTFWYFSKQFCNEFNNLLSYSSY